MVIADNKMKGVNGCIKKPIPVALVLCAGLLIRAVTWSALSGDALGCSKVLSGTVRWMLDWHVPCSIWAFYFQYASNAFTTDLGIRGFTDELKYGFTTRPQSCKCTEGFKHIIWFGQLFSAVEGSQFGWGIKTCMQWMRHLILLHQLETFGLCHSFPIVCWYKYPCTKKL